MGGVFGITRGAENVETFGVVRKAKIVEEQLRVSGDGGWTPDFTLLNVKGETGRLIAGSPISPQPGKV